MMGSEPGLRWIAGVPVGTNLYYLACVAGLSALIWPVATLFLFTVQGTVGAGFSFGALAASALLGLQMIGLGLVAFALIAFVGLRNRLTMIYRFRADGVFCSVVKARTRAMQTGFHWLAHAVQAPDNEARSVEKRVQWSEVRSIRPLPRLRMFVLKGENGPLLRVHCPGQAVFVQALEFARNHVKGNADAA